MTILAAALTVLVAAVPAAAKPKKAKPNAAIARQIAALERTTNALSGEIAALTAQASTLEGSVKSPPAPAIAGPPTPAPETPAGGDFSGSFPNPKLKSGTVGTLELGEGSVTSDKVIDGSIRASAIADGAIGGTATASNAIGLLREENFGSAMGGTTLARRTYSIGESQLFELGVPHEQTLTLSSHCTGRLISGGWKLVPGEFGAEIMASVPSFVTTGKNSEHDWTVAVHEQFTNTTIRNRMDMSGLCIE